MASAKKAKEKKNDSPLAQAKKLAKYNNELEKQNVALQYQYNQSLAQQDRDFQERMANSAHQREIKDLKAAGLNPVLSVTGGSGAATPSGSSASVSKPDVDTSLPKAVMDMAIAQLNSATALQTTAMNNANALNVVYAQGQNVLDQIIQQGEVDKVVKQTTSGDSVSGQVANAPVNIKRFLKNLFTGKFDANDINKSARKTMKKYYTNEQYLKNEIWLNKYKMNTGKKYTRKQERKRARKARKLTRYNAYYKYYNNID